MICDIPRTNSLNPVTVEPIPGFAKATSTPYVAAGARGAMDQGPKTEDGEFRLVKDLEFSASLLLVEYQRAHGCKLATIRNQEEPMSKLSRYVLAVSVSAALTETHACDLCRCETPQVEASPRLPLESAPGQPAGSSQNW